MKRTTTVLVLTALIGATAQAALVGDVSDWSRAQAGPIPGLSESERSASCGLIAAEAALRYYAQDPQLDMIREIRDLALARGWWSLRGMHGPQAETALLVALGVDTQLLWYTNMSDLGAVVAGALDEGRPVLLSTPEHYWFIQGHDGRGNFTVGNTGSFMRGGSPVMTLWQMAQIGRGVNGIVLPQKAAPGSMPPAVCRPGPLVANDCLAWRDVPPSVREAWLARLLPMGLGKEDVERQWVEEHNRDLVDPGWREREPAVCQPGPLVANDCLTWRDVPAPVREAWLARLLPMGLSNEDVERQWVGEHNRDLVDPGWREREYARLPEP